MSMSLYQYQECVSISQMCSILLRYISYLLSKRLFPVSDNVHCKVLLSFTLINMADFVDFLV